MSIIFSRVDGRMIHGQVAIAWTKLLRVDEIVVVNDEIAADDTQAMLLELATPAGVDLKICTVKEAAELISEDRLDGSNTMMLYKNIKDAVKYLVTNMPQWITNWFTVAGGILPALGFEMLFVMMSNKKLVPFFKGTLLSIAVVGIAVALIYVNLTENKDKTKSKA